MAIFLAGVVLAPLLIQGAYYPAIFLTAAIILSCSALLKKQRRPPGCERLLWGIAGLYLIASLVNGYASDSLAQACLPLTCALFLYLYNGFSVSEKSFMLRVIILGGGILAGFSILAFCGTVYFPGAAASHRLQSTFQYANAAGSWFAALAILAQDYADVRIRKFLIPVITALFLTQSVGAISLYIAVQILRIWKNREKSVWYKSALAHILGGIFALGFYFITGWIAWLPVLLMYFVGGYWEKSLPFIQKLKPGWLMVPAAGTAITLAIFSRRFSSSLLTFVERLVQISDGLRVIAAHPFWGVGAGNWGILYPYYQSAQYTSTVIHSSIIQTGVDSGIFAMAAAVIFLICAWKNKKCGLSETYAAGLLIAHSFLDFTMQFFPIAALLLAILFAGEGFTDSASTGPAGRYHFPHIISLLTVILCLTLFYGQLQYRFMARQAQTSDWNAVVDTYEQNEILFGENKAARNIYIRALYYSGGPHKVIDFTEKIGGLTAEEVLLQAQALQQIGEQDRACHLLLEQLAQQIYRVGLFEETARLLLDWKADTEYLRIYNKIADTANSSQTILGACKGDQVYIEHIY